MQIFFLIKRGTEKDGQTYKDKDRERKRDKDTEREREIGLLLD